MKVEILKDHESGLLAGQVKNLNVRDARHLIELGIAEEFDTKEPKNQRKKKDKKV